MGVNTAGYRAAVIYGAAGDSWPPPTPPSLTMLGWEKDDDREMNKLVHNHALFHGN